MELLILIAHRSVSGFNVPTVEVDDLGCRPVETPVWSADRRIQQFGVQTINTTIGSGKPHIVVLLQLLPLLLIVMPVVLLMQHDLECRLRRPQSA